MFCTQCGTRLSDGAKFCGECGAPVATPPARKVEPLVIPAPPNATVVISDEPPMEFWVRPSDAVENTTQVTPEIEPEVARETTAKAASGYTRAWSMTEAAMIAAGRASEWCPWDDARRPSYHGARWMKRKAEIEDRKYGGTNTPWVVSPDGAIGVVGVDGDIEEYGHDVEWWYFTPAVPYADLPQRRSDIGLA